jgi:hypothetical protein
MKNPEKVIAALGLTALCAVGAHVLLAAAARRSYDRCEQTQLPASVADLERAFGSPTRSMQASDGSTVLSFSPSPLYVHFASGSVQATVRPPSANVTSLHCGEGL